MRIFILISIASAFFTSTLAGALPGLDNLPAPTGFAPLNITMISNRGSLEKRQPGGVNICQNINWDNCGYAKQPWDLCIQLDSPWWHSISAIGPDEYNAIVAFEDYNCGSSARLAIFNPGYPNLVPAGWNDRIGSFRVLQISGPTCVYEGDFNAHAVLRSATNCNSCCNGCNRSGTGCCPPGLFC